MSCHSVSFSRYYDTESSKSKYLFDGPLSIGAEYSGRSARKYKNDCAQALIQAQIVRLKHLVGDHLTLRYFLFDGELGHNDAMHMVRQVGMHLISKLRYDSAL